MRGLWVAEVVWVVDVWWFGVVMVWQGLRCKVVRCFSGSDMGGDEGFGMAWWSSRLDDSFAAMYLSARWSRRVHHFRL